MSKIPSESKEKAKCKKKLESWGWMVLHIIQSNQNGITDTILIRDGRIVFVEFKKVGKNIVPEGLQEYRHKKLREKGFEVIVAWGMDELVHLK